MSRCSPACAPCCNCPRSIADCKRLIREFKPDVVFGVGGYAPARPWPRRCYSKFPPWSLSPMPCPASPTASSASASRPPPSTFPPLRVVPQLRSHRHPGAAGVLHHPAARRLRPHLLVFGGSQGARIFNVTFARNHACAARCGSRPHRPAPERRAPRRVHQDGLSCQRRRSWRWQVCRSLTTCPHVCRCAPGSGPQRRIHGGRTGCGRQAGAAGSLCRRRRHHQQRNAEAMVSAGAAVMLQEKDLDVPGRLAGRSDRLC